ncbi:hypothetical protein Vretifemale_1062, partial [Volvox reticuliferus]
MGHPLLVTTATRLSPVYIANFTSWNSPQSRFSRNSSLIPSCKSTRAQLRLWATNMCSPLVAKISPPIRAAPSNIAIYTIDATAAGQWASQPAFTPDMVVKTPTQEGE